MSDTLLDECDSVELELEDNGIRSGLLSGVDVALDTSAWPA
jgi:hypothetical protein